MDTFHIDHLGLFVLGTFAAALITGLAGFAFGIVAAAMWLHFLSPVQSTMLIAVFGLIIQGVSTWKLRAAIKWRRLLPFLVGGAIGVPIGGELLRWAAPGQVRMGIGVILVMFSLYTLFRPKLIVAHVGRIADFVVGIVNGVIGGATGLAGIAAVVWCSMRGWPAAEQRAVFQPTGVAVFLITAVWLGGTGSIDTATLKLFVVGLPALAVGTWIGLKLFGRLNEAAFRRVVLFLLLLSGLALLFPRS
jgi:uncharacterized membrane protein YfcA